MTSPTFFKLEEIFFWVCNSCEAAGKSPVVSDTTYPKRWKVLERGGLVCATCFETSKNQKLHVEKPVEPEDFSFEDFL